MEAYKKGQITGSAAEIYEEFYLPALFLEWGEKVADAAQIQPGERVLDVACGTGVLARAALKKTGQTGSVVGVDVNEGMLAVAKKKAPEIEWRQARAENLPFADNSFEKVVSQFGLMFFEDKIKALQEMKRVLKPGGILAVAVWDALENSPGFAEETELLRRLFGDEIASALEFPFVLGDNIMLSDLFTKAGMADAKIVTHEGTARFPSIESWIHTDIKGWTLAEKIDDEQFQTLMADALVRLKPFVQTGGSVSFPSPAHIVKWGKI